MSTLSVFARVIIATALFIIAGPINAASQSGNDIVKDQCVSCHNIVGPAPSTFNKLIERNAPDLFYAGSKFNRSWLIDWLQNPTPIRYSGNLFLNHVVVQNGKDKLAADAVESHPKLESWAAESVADHLMTLKDDQMAVGVIDRAKKFNKPKALTLFRKRLPCVGCHRIKWGRKTLGGVSGTDLTEAGLRLNPDWVYAMIDDPQYWDPKIAMPTLPMSHKKRELLTLFIASFKNTGDRKNDASEDDAIVSVPGGRGISQLVRGHPADDNYHLYCVQCHGSIGNGRGINDSAGGLTVSPKNHTLAKEMSKLSDENLRLSISKGGDAVQSSGLMPPWESTLSEKAIQDLVHYLRLLCRCEEQ